MRRSIYLDWIACIGLTLNGRVRFITKCAQADDRKRWNAGIPHATYRSQYYFTRLIRCIPIQNSFLPCVMRMIGWQVSNDILAMKEMRIAHGGIMILSAIKSIRNYMAVPHLILTSF